MWFYLESGWGNEISLEDIQLLVINYLLTFVCGKLDWYLCLSLSTVMFWTRTDPSRETKLWCKPLIFFDIFITKIQSSTEKRWTYILIDVVTSIYFQCAVVILISTRTYVWGNWYFYYRSSMTNRKAFFSSIHDRIIMCYFLSFLNYYKWSGAFESLYVELSLLS